jgi:hypothetical protein
MKKFLKIFLILILSQVLIINVFAGSDGTLEVKNNSKVKDIEVKNRFETVNTRYFALTKD